MIEDVTLKGCLEFAIATEERGAKIYAGLASTFSANQEIAQLFSRLAEDEQVHRQQFSQFLKNAPSEEKIISSPGERDYLKAMSLSDFFSQQSGPLRDIEKIQDRSDALQKVLEFEKATLGFYKAVEDVLGPHEMLSQVIEVEKNHVVVLMKALLVEGSAFRSLQDRWP